jgi:hypothetical protein
MRGSDELSRRSVSHVNRNRARSASLVLNPVRQDPSSASLIGTAARGAPQHNRMWRGALGPYWGVGGWELPRTPLRPGSEVSTETRLHTRSLLLCLITPSTRFR